MALKVKQKYATAGQDTPLWVRRTLEPQSGLPPQAMPPVMLSLEYRLIWHTARKSAPLVSIWRPIAPFGYKPAGDVAVMGLDPPQHPVQVRLPSLLPLWPLSRLPSSIPFSHLFSFSYNPFFPLFSGILTLFF